MEQLELLNLPSKQKRRVNSSQDTQEKVVLTEISAIYTKSSLETGKEVLDCITDILYYTCLFERGKSVLFKIFLIAFPMNRCIFDFSKTRYCLIAFSKDLRDCQFLQGFIL